MTLLRANSNSVPPHSNIHAFPVSGLGTFWLFRASPFRSSCRSAMLGIVQFCCRDEMRLVLVANAVSKVKQGSRIIFATHGAHDKVVNNILCLLLFSLTTGFRVNCDLLT